MPRQRARTEQEEEKRRLGAPEIRARRREAEGRRLEESRAEQLQAGHQARMQRQSAEDAEEKFLAAAADGILSPQRV